MKTMTALSALIILLLAPSAISQVQDDRLIVPGQRIGKWTLEMTLGELRRINGSENDMIRTVPADSAIVEPIVHYWANLGFSVATSRGGEKPVLLTALSGQYRTAQGIAVGATQALTERAYGRAPTMTNWNPGDPTAIRLIYDDLGIAVRLRGGTADSIYVFKPKTAKSLWRF